MAPPAAEGTHHDREDPERVARGLVRLAQSHRQLCANFLRDHRDRMDTPAVAKFAARIRMFDRVIASASLALSNLPDDNNDRHAMLRATIDSMAEDTTADLMPQPDPSREWGAAVPSFPGMRLHRSPRARRRPMRLCNRPRSSGGHVASWRD
jgi:hypothetical protein